MLAIVFHVDLPFALHIFVFQVLFLFYCSPFVASFHLFLLENQFPLYIMVGFGYQMCIRVNVLYFSVLWFDIAFIILWSVVLCCFYCCCFSHSVLFGSHFMTIIAFLVHLFMDVFGAMHNGSTMIIIINVILSLFLFPLSIPLFFSLSLPLPIYLSIHPSLFNMIEQYSLYLPEVEKRWEPQLHRSDLSRAPKYITIQEKHSIFFTQNEKLLFPYNFMHRLSNYEWFLVAFRSNPVSAIERNWIISDQYRNAWLIYSVWRNGNTMALLMLGFCNGFHPIAYECNMV